MKFLAYYTGPSKPPYHYIRSLKTHSYTFLQLSHPAYHIAHHVETLFNSRYFPTGKGTCQTTKVLLSNYIYTSDCKPHLIKIQLVLLMCIYKLIDIRFL